MTAEPVPSSARIFWQRYLDSLAAPADAVSRFYESFRIGDTRESADAGAALISRGVKTATSALLWEYESEDRQPPRVRALSIVEDGQGQPVCIVETLETEIVPFAEIDAQFARDYGEWDGTLAAWRERCWDYYSSLCHRLGRTPSMDMPLVCERFRVVFP